MSNKVTPFRRRSRLEAETPIDGRIVFEVGPDRFAIDYAITELSQKTGAQRCGLPYHLSTITRKKTWHRSQPPSQQTRQPLMRSPKTAGWRSRKNLV